MLSICSYKNYNSNPYKTVTISRNHRKDANYNRKYYSKLAPKLSF